VTNAIALTEGILRYLPRRLPMTTTASSDTCDNCLRSISNHRPWCAQVKTTPPPKEGDIVDHPLLGPTPILSVYSRQMAIADGTLVDCTHDILDQINREAGLKFDVAMTATAFTRYVDVSDLTSQEDIGKRYRDVVIAFRHAALQAEDESELTFRFVCLPNGEGYLDNERIGFRPEYRLATLKAICHSGDRGEPCLTIMLPDED